MICVKCGEWQPDQEGDTCEDCRRRAKADTRIIDRATVARELELEEEARQEGWLNDLKGRIIRRYEIPDGLKCEHLPGCSFPVIHICTCGFLFDLGRVGADGATRMYLPFMEEIKLQTEAAQRLL